MKNRLVILLGLILFVACKRREKQQLVVLQKDSIHILNNAIVDSDTTKRIINEEQGDNIDELDGELKTISAAEYKNLDSSSMPRCGLDSNGFVKGLGVTIKNKCDEVNEVCENYLIKMKSGKTMPLHAEFDAGLFGLRVSPQCDRFVTYSSYDMPDYDKYYDHRALIVLYHINKGVGLKAIEQKRTLSLNVYSIKEVKWLDEKSIALKLYKEAYSDEVKFAYFKVKIE